MYVADMLLAVIVPATTVPLNCIDPPVKAVAAAVPFTSNVYPGDVVLTPTLCAAFAPGSVIIGDDELLV